MKVFMEQRDYGTWSIVNTKAMEHCDNRVHGAL